MRERGAFPQEKGYYVLREVRDASDSFGQPLRPIPGVVSVGTQTGMGVIKGEQGHPQKWPRHDSTRRLLLAG